MDNKKILIVYFSHSGNTREVAMQIHELTRGDLCELETLNAYPTDYDEVAKVAEQEQKSGILPKLKNTIPDIEPYRIIFIGSPMWWYTIAPAVKTFLSQHDLSGKTLIPFSTYEGSGLGHSEADIRKLCPNATILARKAIEGGKVKGSRATIEDWLKSNKII